MDDPTSSELVTSITSFLGGVQGGLRVVSFVTLSCIVAFNGDIGRFLGEGCLVT